MDRKYWTKQEEQFIEENIATKTISEFSDIFKVSKEKITDKIHKMGLNSKKARGVIWSPEDDKLLTAIFEFAPKNYIMEKFPNKTWAAIKQRGFKTLNLKRFSQDRLSVDFNFFEKWTPESAYIFGFIMADGCIHYGDVNYLQFEIAKKDKDILYKIKDALKYEGNVSVGKTARLQINNKKIIKDLIDKGIPAVSKTYCADFPKTLPEGLYKDFCRGVIDGDGWSTVNNNTYNIGLCGNFDLINKIKNVLPEDCSNNHIRKDKDSFCWRFNIKGKKALKIAKWLYEDACIYLDRKYQAYYQNIV